MSMSLEVRGRSLAIRSDLGSWSVGKRTRAGQRRTRTHCPCCSSCSQNPYVSASSVVMLWSLQSLSGDKLYRDTSASRLSLLHCAVWRLNRTKPRSPSKARLLHREERGAQRVIAQLPVAIDGVRSAEDCTSRPAPTYPLHELATLKGGSNARPLMLPSISR
jgi:hypothetical protein